VELGREQLGPLHTTSADCHGSRPRIRSLRLVIDGDPQPILPQQRSDLDGCNFMDVRAGGYGRRRDDLLAHALLIIRASFPDNPWADYAGPACRSSGAEFLGLPRRKMSWN
jgi:hypothetical protein